MTADYLTCGQCSREFPLQGITLFIQHKKLDCDDAVTGTAQAFDLKCNFCEAGFMTAWGLLLHAQITHKLTIFLENTSKSTVHNQTTPLPRQLQNIQSFKSSQKLGDSQTSITESEITLSAASIKNDTTLVSENRDRTVKDLSKAGRKFSEIDLTKPSGLQDTFKEHGVSNAIDLQGTCLRFMPAKVTYTTMAPNPILPATQVKLLPRPSKTIPESGTLVFNTSSSMPSFSFGASRNITLAPVTPILPYAVTSGVTFQEKHLSVAPKVTAVVATIANTPFVSSNNTSNILPNTFPLATTSAAKTDLSSENITENTNNQQLDTDMELEESADLDPEEEDKLVEEDIDTGQACCNDQGCGVTVIPGSHEHLQKCCNAVVPKKRKRHMELKHMPFSWGSSRYARRKMMYRSRACNAARTVTSYMSSKPQSRGTIYIDVESDSLLSNDSQGASFSVHQSVDDTHESEGFTELSQPSEATPTKQRSLILKPGTLFSIPFTYSFPATCILPSTGKVPSSSCTSTVSIESNIGTQAYSQIAPNTTASILVKSNTSPKSQTGTKEMIRSSILAKQSSKTATTQSTNSDSDYAYRSESSKPFHCEKCTMAFNQRIHLKKHMSKHTGIKPYKCGECDYSTVERSHLKVHIRIHTGEKPFKCTYCEYATAQNSTLKIHLKRHHSSRMFQCSTCSKQFTEEQQLQGHAKEHKPGSTVTSQANGVEDSSLSSSGGVSQDAPGLTNQQPAVYHMPSLVEYSANQTTENRSSNSTAPSANEIEDVGHVVSIPETSKNENQK